MEASKPVKVVTLHEDGTVSSRGVPIGKIEPPADRRSTAATCQVEIPGVGQCQVEGEHRYDGRGREIHVHGPCSWNGGLLIEVSDDALDAAAKARDWERNFTNQDIREEATVHTDDGPRSVPGMSAMDTAKTLGDIGRQIAEATITRNYGAYCLPCDSYYQGGCPTHGVVKEDHTLIVATTSGALRLRVNEDSTAKLVCTLTKAMFAFSTDGKLHEMSELRKVGRQLADDEKIDPRGSYAFELDQPGDA